MTQFHAASSDASLALAATNLPPTRVIELGDITAGIAVPERGGVRFFSSERRFDALDGTLFRSVEQAVRAARTHRQGQPRLRAG